MQVRAGEVSREVNILVLLLDRLEHLNLKFTRAFVMVSNLVPYVGLPLFGSKVCI